MRDAPCVTRREGERGAVPGGRPLRHAMAPEGRGLFASLPLPGGPLTVDAVPYEAAREGLPVGLPWERPVRVLWEDAHPRGRVPVAGEPARRLSRAPCALSWPSGLVGLWRSTRPGRRAGEGPVPRLVRMPASFSLRAAVPATRSFRRGVAVPLGSHPFARLFVVPAGQPFTRWCLLSRVPPLPGRNHARSRALCAS